MSLRSVATTTFVLALAACSGGGGGGPVSCRIASLTGPLVAKEAFAKGNSLVAPPDSIPPSVPPRIAAGHAPRRPRREEDDPAAKGRDRRRGAIGREKIERDDGRRPLRRGRHATVIGRPAEDPSSAAASSMRPAASASRTAVDDTRSPCTSYDCMRATSKPWLALIHISEPTRPY